MDKLITNTNLIIAAIVAAIIISTIIYYLLRRYVFYRPGTGTIITTTRTIGYLANRMAEWELEGMTITYRYARIKVVPSTIEGEKKTYTYIIEYW